MPEYNEELQETPDVDTEIKEARSGITTEDWKSKLPVNEYAQKVQAEFIPEKAEPKMVEIVTDDRYKLTDRYKIDTTSIMNPVEYQQMKQIALDFQRSGSLPEAFKNSEQILVVLIAGAEMGMKPFEAIGSLYFVHGSLNIWGKAIIRRLREHGWVVTYSNETAEGVTATVSRGKESYSESYAFADAEASRYTKDRSGGLKVGWLPGLNRKLKLRYGVLSLIIKSYIPEVLGTAANIVEVQQDISFDVPTERDKIPDEVFSAAETLLREATSAEHLKSRWLNLPGRVKLDERLIAIRDELKGLYANN